MGAMIDSENGISARDRSKEIIEDDVACATKDIMDPVERRYEAALVRKQAHKDIRNFLRAVGLEE